MPGLNGRNRNRVPDAETFPASVRTAVTSVLAVAIGARAVGPVAGVHFLRTIRNRRPSTIYFRLRPRAETRSRAGPSGAPDAEWITKVIPCITAPVAAAVTIHKTDGLAVAQGLHTAVAQAVEVQGVAAEALVARAAEVVAGFRDLPISITSPVHGRRAAVVRAAGPAGPVGPGIAGVPNLRQNAVENSATEG